jgi:hypothetical protein
MSEKVREWSDFFNSFFDEVKRVVPAQYSLEEDGSGPPEILVVREVVTNFPCPLRIAEIKIDLKKHREIEDDLCQIIRYDFSKLEMAGGTVEYYGIFDEEDPKLRELLEKKFDLSFPFEEFKEFRTIAWFDDKIESYVQFTLYNIKKDIKRFISDFLTGPFNDLVARMRRSFNRKVYWNSKFNLKPDPILSTSEITRMDPTLRGFLPFSKGAGIEELQKDICDIVLIPSVPDPVKGVFRRAKDLFIFGFFRYRFFTISFHYSYLALESAIRHKYYQSLGEKALLSEKGETIEVRGINHQRVLDICKQKGWNIHNLRINGEKFVFSQNGLLNWLLGKRIITIWEKKMCESGMNFRNIMSHVMHPPVFLPSHSIQALEFVADIINRLYSS